VAVFKEAGRGGGGAGGVEQLSLRRLLHEPRGGAGLLPPCSPGWGLSLSLLFLGRPILACSAAISTRSPQQSRLPVPCLQRWVHKKGGKRVALSRPEVAVALRDRIASALEQPLRTDATHWANWKEKGAGAGAAAADGVQADQANTEQGQGQQVAMEEEEDGWGASDR
jgi:hypothetical protein